MAFLFLWICMPHSFDFPTVLSVFLDLQLTPEGCEAMQDCAEYITGEMLDGSRMPRAIREASMALGAQFPHMLGGVSREAYGKAHDAEKERLGVRLLFRDELVAFVSRWVEEQRLALRFAPMVSVQSVRELIGDDAFLEMIAVNGGGFVYPKPDAPVSRSARRRPGDGSFSSASPTG